MSKKIVTIFVVFLINLAFATTSFAIILENMPTKSSSVQPIPASVTSNMSKNFNITVYKSGNSINDFSSTTSLDNSSMPNSQTNTSQNNSKNKTTKNTAWYFIISFILITTVILSWRSRKSK
jgi:hypothetical protein